METYIHRIGRTARAGRGGKSCTMIGEGRRHLMKALIKDAAHKNKEKKAQSSRLENGVIRSRSVPAAVIAHFANKIRMLEPHLKEVLQAEAIARLDRLADMEAAKAQNLIQHSSEIQSRPPREWFTSNKQKQLTKEAMAEKHQMIVDKIGKGNHRMTRKKRRKREALNVVPELDEDGNDIFRPDHQTLMKTSARAAKRRIQELEREAYGKSISEKSNDGAKKEHQKKKIKKADANAVGDSSLFNEDNVIHAKRKKHKEESFQFRDTSIEQPMRRKRTKKKAVNAFKSKSKYKRR